MLFNQLVVGTCLLFKFGFVKIFVKIFVRILKCIELGPRYRGYVASLDLADTVDIYLPTA